MKDITTMRWTTELWSYYDNGHINKRLWIDGEAFACVQQRTKINTEKLGLFGLRVRYKELTENDFVGLPATFDGRLFDSAESAMKSAEKTYSNNPIGAMPP